MPPPTRREQLELDELLSDIYRGIETLPDKSQNSFVVNPNEDSWRIYQQQQQPAAAASSNRSATSDLQQREQQLYDKLSARSHVRQYELPASSPLVRQHRQEVEAALRGSSSANSKQPHRSTLKRHTNTPDQQQEQSLASFVTSNTPENKRRVRIVDPQQEQRRSPERRKVKYVNTNKLIYHQEREPQQVGGEKDEGSSNADEDDNNNNNYEEEDDEQDIDGVTRVEYYHTSWLDRQLGRASNRRSSKELNERQVKEKAMIEELKRSLKNGAISLRQSLKPSKSNNRGQHQVGQHKQPSKSPDTHLVGSSQHQLSKHKEASSRSTVFGSGLATLPRNHQHHHHHHQQQQQPASQSHPTPKQTATLGRKSPQIISTSTPDYQASGMQIKQEQSDYSRTLPHNYSQKHQLLQSHYRGNTLGKQVHSPTPSQPADATKSVHYSKTNNVCAPTVNANYSSSSLSRNQQHQAAESISGIPSSTEVVRSALSKSNSQLNLLNKSINLLASSPAPNAASPMSPAQRLSAATPSLSPSPVAGCPPSGGYNSQTLGVGSHFNMNQPVLHGTRTIARGPQQETPAHLQQQQQQQPVYANPHAAYMQHRAEQQMRKPQASNGASIREFNELDSLLRSLSPHQSSVHITPGYSTKPAAATFGLGVSPAPQQQQHDLYARVQKQQNQAPVSRGNYGQNITSNNSAAIATHEPFTIDVSNKKADENCLHRSQRNEELSEFEPTVELLPTMEDYQNIGKLNPVKNQYWYKPNMSRDRAIALLKDKPQGTFIVRDSTSFRGAYGLAVKVAKLPKNVLNNASLRNPNGDPSAEFIRHFLIEPVGQGVRLKGYNNEPVFDSLPDLIYQHSLTELALPCRLIIPRADIEDARFNLKQKQFFDDFLASKEQAKHNPYDRTSPNGGYRRYPGDVYVHNEHRMIFE